MSKDMRIRFEGEEPDFNWKSSEVLHWVRKHRDNYGQQNGISGEAEGHRNERVHETYQTIGSGFRLRRDSRRQ